MTTNITRTSADGRTSAKLEGYESCIPLSFRHGGKAFLAEQTDYLCFFLQTSLSAFFESEYFDLDKKQREEFSMGLDACFNLMRDRLKIISGETTTPRYVEE